MEQGLRNEAFEYFIDTLNQCGLFLLKCDDEEIGYRLFEEFDAGSISFLHENTLTPLLDAGLINIEIFDKSLELAVKFRKLENTPLWDARKVKDCSEWLEILKLSDEIKNIIEKTNSNI